MIELRTDLTIFAPENHSGIDWDDVEHDALVAHAFLQAIEEAKAESLAREEGTNAMPGPWWIERRAAAILTTLLNETPS